MPRWPAVLMPASSNAVRISARPAFPPPASREAATSPAVPIAASSMPSSRCRAVNPRSVLCAVNSSIQPMSSAGTRCRVPRIGQDRMNSPRFRAASTSAMVESGARRPTDHLAPGRSCACRASIQRTTSAGQDAPLPPIRWAARRSRRNRRASRTARVIRASSRTPPTAEKHTKTHTETPRNQKAARRGRHRATMADDPRTVRLSARGRSRRLKGWSPGHVTGDRQSLQPAVRWNPSRGAR